MSLDKKQLTEALAKAREESSSIKFDQTVDLIVTLKDIDMKKPDQHVDFFMQLPNQKAKPTKICGLVGSELIDDAKKELDFAISDADFAATAADKSKLKAIASEYDFFVAQANVMPKVAQFFGRVLGPRSKMPNPKAGCVVPPKASLSAVKSRLQKTLHVAAKKAPHMQLAVGSQSLNDDQLVENVSEVYNQILSHLPLGINNVKRVYVKFTMSKTQRVY